jgi:hypothetical protein
MCKRVVKSRDSDAVGSGVIWVDGETEWSIRSW